MCFPPFATNLTIDPYVRKFFAKTPLIFSPRFELYSTGFEAIKITNKKVGICGNLDFFKNVLNVLKMRGKAKENGEQTDGAYD